MVKKEVFDWICTGQKNIELRKEKSRKVMLKEMQRLAANGITEFTSTLLRDKLGLDKESGRDQVCRLMRKLEKDDKVVISRKDGTKG